MDKMDEKVKRNWDLDHPGATFQYVTGQHSEMIGKMVGRDQIKSEIGILIPGTELCIQKIPNIRDDVPENSPDTRSSRQILTDNFDENFELYLVRPNPHNQSAGAIWYITPEEFDLARDWELVDYGCQEDFKTIAITSDGIFKAVVVHGLQKQPFNVDEVVNPETYSDFIVSKEKMLETAEKERLEYLARQKGNKKE